MREEKERGRETDRETAREPQSLPGVGGGWILYNLDLMNCEVTSEPESFMKTELVGFTPTEQ